MERVIEVLLFLMAGVLGIVCSYSDCKNGLIYNKVLLPFFCIGLILDGIYYGFFMKDLFFAFAANVLIVFLIALILFQTSSFAGGDCKMAAVLAVLYPGSCYLSIAGVPLSLFLYLAFAILAGYGYLLLNSLWALISRKNTISKSHVIQAVKNFLFSYFLNSLYLSLIYQLFSLSGLTDSYLGLFLARIIAIAIVFIVGKYRFLRQWYCWTPVALVCLVLCIFFRRIPFSTNIENYVLVLALLLAKIIMSTNLYEEIPVSTLKKGNVLSFASSLEFQTSRFKNLPGISSENLSSRLNEDQVESIKRWAASRSVTSITVVKKIPFAIFLFIGYISYFLIWSVFI
jgi:preflagellin peptidase FlaK